MDSVETKPKQPIFKKWWFWVGIIVLIGVVGAAGKRGKAEADSQRQSSSAVSTSTPESAAATSTPEPSQAQKTEEKAAQLADQKSHTVSANSLGSQYEANKIAADSKYKGKTFYVTGTVESIGEDILGDAYVILKSEGTIMGVHCTMSTSDDLAQVSKGQSVIIKGTGGSSTLGLSMDDCILIKN